MTRLVHLAAVFAAAWVAVPVLAQPGPQPASMLAQPTNVAVTEAWARASAGPSGTGAVYATVTASQPDRLTGANTPVADMAELHQTTEASGIMQMRPVAGGLPLTPGTPVHLNPGGYHVMLMGLKQPLRKGEHFPITFTFQHAASVTATVTVSGPGATQPDMGPQAGMTQGTTMK